MLKHMQASYNIRIEAFSEIYWADLSPTFLQKIHSKTSSTISSNGFLTS